MDDLLIRERDSMQKRFPRVGQLGMGKGKKKSGCVDVVGEQERAMQCAHTERGGEGSEDRVQKMDIQNEHVEDPCVGDCKLEESPTIDREVVLRQDSGLDSGLGAGTALHEAESTCKGTANPVSEVISSLGQCPQDNMNTNPGEGREERRSVILNQHKASASLPAAHALKCGSQRNTPNMVVDPPVEACTGVIGAVKRTRSGRTSAPVLDWWRSQRLSHNQDGVVVVDGGSSHDELFHNKPFMSTCSHATAEKWGPGRRGPVQSGEEPQLPHEHSSEWTKAQLRMLHLAQAGLDPGISNFWEHVASSVEGKDALACQEKWFAQLGTPKQRKRKGTQKQGTSFSSQPTDQKGGKQGIACETHKAHADDLFLDHLDGSPLYGHTGTSKNHFSRRDLSREMATPGGKKAGNSDRIAAGSHPNEKEGNQVSRSYIQAVSKKLRKSRQGDITKKCHLQNRHKPAVATVFHGNMKASVTDRGTVTVMEKVYDVSDQEVSDSGDSGDE
ncbi:unnamed protein product [Discosporangium mesarthrocarpum]